MSDAASVRSRAESQKAQENSTHGDDADVEKGGEPGTPRDFDPAFDVTCEADTDPDSPRTFNKPRKWLIVAVVATCSICVTVNSSLYTTTYDQIVPYFNSNREIATLGLSTFVIGLMIGPMILAPLSEFFGRRLTYIGSFAMIFIWLIPCAVAKNIATILVTRFFQGFFSSAFLSVAGGTIGDMFNKQELSFPMMIYSASPFLGPVLGPLIGGFINEFTDWRWSFWVLLIWTGVELVLLIIFVPETYQPVLLKWRAAKMRKEKNDDRWTAALDRHDMSIGRTIMWSCVRPLQLLIYEPMVLNLCLLSALLLGILYLFFGACEFAPTAAKWTRGLTNPESPACLSDKPRVQLVPGRLGVHGHLGWRTACCCHQPALAVDLGTLTEAA